ncbi:hypothetical protein D3C86_1453340 [compost metagenome]
MDAGSAAAPVYLSGSSVTTTVFTTPSACIWAAICGTVSTPSTGCPPVMATASLNRILYVMLARAATAARMASSPE